MNAGARQSKACQVLGLSARCIERWRALPDGGDDQRRGPLSEPANKLSPKERQQLLATVNSAEFCDKSPWQIVATLADRGHYLASEKSIYRELHAQQMQQHRGRSRAPQPRSRPRGHTATAPNQLWSWDITYLPTSTRGVFLYLYLIMDVYSRKIVGFEVSEHESMELSSSLLSRTFAAEHVRPGQLVLHADNGGPMKGSTMLATLRRLGVMASFSRPRVSDDNPFSEALFRTMKYRAEYPQGGAFSSLEQARQWVTGFVHWYNEEHKHSAIRYVTPSQRHAGEDVSLLARRDEVYRLARQRQPGRWSGSTRDWSPITEVHLNGGANDGERRVGSSSKRDPRKAH